VESTYARARRADREAVLTTFGEPGDSLLVTWDRMIPDPTGRLWLRFSACINERDRIWDVIDTTGAQVGTLRSNLHIIAAFERALLVRGETAAGNPELAIWKLVPR
jgi:hypothetical protein